jgi:hypothetical protein
MEFEPTVVFPPGIALGNVELHLPQRASAGRGSAAGWVVETSRPAYARAVAPSLRFRFEILAYEWAVIGSGEQMASWPEM